MQKYIIFFCFFGLSQCSLYNLSTNPLMKDLFPILPPKDPEVIPSTSIIKLISPNISSLFFADSFPIQIEIDSPREGIKSIDIEGATFSSNINFSTILDKATITKTIVLSNSSSYNTTSGQYSLEVSLTDGNDVVTTSNYTILVKIDSVHLESIQAPDTRPLSQTSWNNSVLRIRPFLSGAPIQNIMIFGGILGPTGGMFSTNITSGYDTITIPFSVINPTLITDPFNIEIRIRSESSAYLVATNIIYF